MNWDTVSVTEWWDLNALISHVKKAKYLTFDVETQSDEDNMEDWHRSSRITCASFTFSVHPDHGFVLPLSHIDSQWGWKWRSILKEVLGAIPKDCRIIGHNLKYDIRWAMRHTGLDLTPNMWWDTMIVAHLFDENQPKRLKELAGPLMGGDWSQAVDLSDSEHAPWYPLAKYNAADTVATWRLHRQQYEVLKGMPRLARLFHYVQMPALRALTQAEINGLPIDRDAVGKALSEAQDASHFAERELLDLAKTYGMDPNEVYTTATGLVRKKWKVSWQGTSKWWREFTERAMEHGHLRITKMTPGGQPSFDSDALSQQGTALADTVLAFRNGDKQAQFLRSWLEKADGKGRLHPTFKPAKFQGGTVTGRTSSSNPNTQQIDRRLKPCFSGGRWFVEIDYSQIEMRIAAEMIERCDIWEGVNPMMLAYVAGADLHTLIVQETMGIEEPTKDDRQKGKAINFGFLFGMGPNGFVEYARAAYGVEFTLDEAKTIHRRYYDAWQGLDYWHAQQKQMALTQGYVENLFGRRRHLPDITSGNPEWRARAERQAINAPVQGAASDLMMMSLGQIHRTYSPEDVTIVGTVHDSVLLEVDDRALVEDICRIMVAPAALDHVLDRPLTVPIEVEAEIGRRWADPECDTFVLSSPAL